MTNAALTTVVPDGAEIDLADLRADRRARLFAAMADHDLDVLILGRAGDVAFATGARQLWTAGTRPFGPACVAVRQTQRTHLLSTWDEGVPPEISRDDLFGLSWNPAIVAASLAAIPGLASARRVGTGSSTPGFPKLLEAIAPGAEVVDGSAAIRAARARKTADELACIATATAVAEAALTAMVDALRPGVTERELLGVYLECIASRGAPTAPTEGVVCAPGGGPRPRLRRLASDRPITAGELVVIDPSACFAGYEGGVGRTWILGGAAASAAQQALGSRCRTALDAVVGACRAGATGRDLKFAWESTGEPMPAEPLVLGVGLGAEPPVVAGGIGDDAVLTHGTVLAVTGWVSEPGVGGFLERDLVVVGDGPAEVLTRYGHGPAGAARATGGST